MSDPQGGFAFEGLPRGTWSVHARAPDGSEAIVNDVAAGNANLLVRLHRPSGIDGTLVGHDAPPAAIYARLLSRKGGLIPGQMGNSTFHISLAAGVYIVSAMNATEGDVQRVEVREGETTQVTMTSHGHARVVGTVVDYATGAPVPDLVCHLVLAAGGSRASRAGTWRQRRRRTRAEPSPLTPRPRATCTSPVAATGTS